MTQQQRTSLLFLLPAFMIGVLLVGGIRTFLQQQGQARADEVAATSTTETANETIASDSLPMAHAAHVTIIPENQLPDLGTEFKLPNPSSMSVPEFEKQLFEFLNSRKYQEHGWASDKSMRDTGPFIEGKYYGTHPAVRVYYSPGMIRWLAGGRAGKISDGEMLIKEQYQPPAARHTGKSEEDLRASLKSWTIMIKDSAGSHDGWFWANPSANPKVADNHKYPFDHPISGFGHYCVRCHSATQSPNAISPSENNEFTFASLRNIKGFPGEPLIFRVDDSWREEEKPKPKPDLSNEDKLKDVAKLKKKKDDDTGSHPRCTQAEHPERCQPFRNEEFIAFYNNVTQQQRDEIKPIPPITHDWVVQHTGGNAGFVTSNQCMSCHVGLTGELGPSMFIPVEKGKTGYGADGWHVSPYGEWRWTPMGLAGRDPVFYAQMESEIAILQKEFAADPEQRDLITNNLQNTCLRCHGAMGKHQFDTDHPDAEQKFSLKDIYTVAKDDAHVGMGDAKYGALARDGISCMVCHRSQPREQPEDDTRSYLEFYLETSITGNLHFGPPNEIYGPYRDDELAPYAMHHATAIKPKHSEYIKSSRMCGSCHVVNLPIVDEPFLDSESKDPNDPKRVLAAAEGIEEFKDFHHHIEQATYLEWLNSEYENEFNEDNPKAQSCQDCHMSKGLLDERHELHVANIETRIAAVQDNTYPDAENLASHKDLDIKIRDDYSRHNFVGLNVFLLELFNQYDDVLGVRKNDFMTGSKIDLQNSIENMLIQARSNTANLNVVAKRGGKNADGTHQLTANVLVENKAGHRFPSGVGFRRAFLELLVVERPADASGEERIVWSSGRTNSFGALIGEDGQPLPGEFFDVDQQTGEEIYYPHREVITSPSQVQVYETMLQNHSGRITTSFIHGCITIKDNRLLPRGWKKEGPDPALKDYFLKATQPGPIAKKDPQYTDGSGSDQTTYEIAFPADIDPDRLTVRATLYYQSMPPYFLKSLFELAPNGEATRRLHHMLSNIRLEGTAIEDWKLPVVSTETDPTR